jgi:hypothetical protein
MVIAQFGMSLSILCVRSCYLNEQFFGRLKPPLLVCISSVTLWCLILYSIHLQFTQSTRSNFVWVRLAKLRYSTPLPPRLVLTGFTVNRIRSVIPRIGDRRFYCRITLLFPPQDEDWIQKVVTKISPGVWSG